MLMAKLHTSVSSSKTLFGFHNQPPLTSGKYGTPISFPVSHKPFINKLISSDDKSNNNYEKINTHICQSTDNTSATTTTTTTATPSLLGFNPGFFEDRFSQNVKAVIYVSVKSYIYDRIEDLVGETLRLELVAAEVDRKSGKEKETIKGHARRKGYCEKNSEVMYECEFKVPNSFGELGAILVVNEHHSEIYLDKIVLEGFRHGTVTVTCKSWVHSQFDSQEKRIFFTNYKLYLPSDTPSGLVKYREKELLTLRGDGTGKRKSYERVYDYDVYNDLGMPDDGVDKSRPVLGGTKHPYPRRCRTGRSPTKTEITSESRTGSNIYVPRDEAFSTVKDKAFKNDKIYCALHTIVPQIESKLIDPDMNFPHFSAIDSLLNEGLELPDLGSGLHTIIPRFIKFVSNFGKSYLRFEVPQLYERDRFSWLRDVEFSRQTLAGINPCSIKLVTEWPLMSKLDREEYGPQESALTTEVIEKEIQSFMTVEEAIKQKKLFMLDYHDVLLPFVKKVRDLEGTTLYGSRTLFFLAPDDTLKTLAIELTRPPMDGKPQWKEVYKPSWVSTKSWLWKLAKLHVLAHDSGHHQLISHWLRTHCATEPYVIATNRQLSGMHPIYKLLHPHLRYTMDINARAREVLVCADGFIEKTFSPQKYSMELSSYIYDLEWRFDHQALPADLINRGMAVEDPSAPNGLKLAIEDYPYASDGLVLWDIIKKWVTDYVNHYYPDSNPKSVESDYELQAWWKEIREVGHGDKKDEPWWPVLKTPHDLIGILTTIIWIASGHHAAVNFGQYDFAGYIPNRPTIARTIMPTEDKSHKRWEQFLKKPEGELLSSFPTQLQGTTVMMILDILSNHSPDEEYIGEFIEQVWDENPVIKSAFNVFSGRLKELAGIIDVRNANEKLRNRHGAGILPYELLKPSSGPGVTSKGVPNSISI